MITFADFYKKITPNASKMITYKVHHDKFITSSTLKIILSSSIKNDNIQAFKNENIYTMKNDNILYTRK